MDFKKNTVDVKDESKLLLHELNENPYKKFNVAFTLMSIIPFLVFFYLLVSKLFSIDILAGDIGLIMLVTLVISLLGYYIGYRVIKKVFDKIIDYAAHAKYRDKLKSEFVAFASHELKTPLSVMKINLTNLGLGILGEVNAAQRNIIGTCQDMIGRMDKLISDMLDLYKIEAGMVKLNVERCDLKRILERQVREFVPLFMKKNINLDEDIAKDEFMVSADRDKIEEVINNLLSNAAKFTPDNGIVKLRLFPNDEFLRFEVRDSGPGISKDRLLKIFDKFETSGIKRESTGLGLAISRDIVELHKGKIWAESEEGNGTTFTVLLRKDLNS